MNIPSRFICNNKNWKQSKYTDKQSGITMQWNSTQQCKRIHYRTLNNMDQFQNNYDM